MDSDVVVKLEHVSKKFCKNLKRGMAYGITDLSRNLLGLRSRSDVLRKGEFWAVDDVSFELRRGETLGLLGPNGAGKTTLLQLINGIFWPDKGKITVRGRVGSLIAVGAGFHPQLTGRENIFVNAAILGMSRREAERKFDEIVEFAGIGPFLDTPVKHYSSGMFVRLGFAIAAHCDPDILLIDEILAVGDVAFRSRCYDRLSMLAPRLAILLVSHHEPSIARTCQRVAYLRQGQVAYIGGCTDTLLRYHLDLPTEQNHVTENGLRLAQAQFSPPEGSDGLVLHKGSNLCCVFSLISDHLVAEAQARLTFLTASGEFVAEWNSWTDSGGFTLAKGSNTLEINLASVDLNPGRYYLSLLVTTAALNENLLWHHRAWPLLVVHGRSGNAPYLVRGSVTCSQPR